jgi:hypothetical protein
MFGDKFIKAKSTFDTNTKVNAQTHLLYQCLTLNRKDMINYLISHDFINMKLLCENGTIFLDLAYTNREEHIPYLIKLGFSPEGALKTTGSPESLYKLKSFLSTYESLNFERGQDPFDAMNIGNKLERYTINIINKLSKYALERGFKEVNISAQDIKDVEKTNSGEESGDILLKWKKSDYETVILEREKNSGDEPMIWIIYKHKRQSNTGLYTVMGVDYSTEWLDNDNWDLYYGPPIK